MIGVDQPARRPCVSASLTNPAVRGSVATSSTTTGSRRNAAVPQMPCPSPTARPSTALVKLRGRLGAAAWRSTLPPPGPRSIKRIEASMPDAWDSATCRSFVSVCGSGARPAMSSRTACWPSLQRSSRSAIARAVRSSSSVVADIASSLTSAVSCSDHSRGAGSIAQRQPRTLPVVSMSGAPTNAGDSSSPPIASGARAATTRAHSSVTRASCAVAADAPGTTRVSPCTSDTSAAGARSAVAAQRVSRSSAAAAWTSSADLVTGSPPVAGRLIDLASTCPASDVETRCLRA